MRSSSMTAVLRSESETDAGGASGAACGAETAEGICGDADAGVPVDGCGGAVIGNGGGTTPGVCGCEAGAGIVGCVTAGG
jgi:hypothetical protein